MILNILQSHLNVHNFNSARQERKWQRSIDRTVVIIEWHSAGESIVSLSLSLWLEEHSITIGRTLSSFWMSFSASHRPVIQRPMLQSTEVAFRWKACAWTYVQIKVILKEMTIIIKNYFAQEASSLQSLEGLGLFEKENHFENPAP